jgi:hypothetical protein
MDGWVGLLSVSGTIGRRVSFVPDRTRDALEAGLFVAIVAALVLAGCM